MIKSSILKQKLFLKVLFRKRRISSSICLWCLCTLFAVYIFFSLIAGKVVNNAEEVEEPSEDKFRTTGEWSPGLARPVNTTTANGHAAKRKRADTPGKHNKGCKGKL